MTLKSIMLKNYTRVVDGEVIYRWRLDPSHADKYIHLELTVEDSTGRHKATIDTRRYNEIVKIKPG